VNLLPNHPFNLPLSQNNSPQHQPQPCHRSAHHLQRVVRKKAARSNAVDMSRPLAT
jgi:hypothetical protein